MLMFSKNQPIKQKRWINTKVEFIWDGSQYVEQSAEGYWYDGEMALCWTVTNNPWSSQYDVGIGTESPGAKLGVADSNFPVIKANRTGQSANNLWSTMGLQATHTGDAGDGFGAGLLTQFQDTSGTFNLGVFGFIRDGGDYKGKFLVQNNDGTAGDNWKQNFVVEPDGNVGIGTTSPDYKLQVSGSIAPETTNTYDLGSTTKRWANVYAGDLHLQNEVGDWTVEEGEEELFITNNKTGKKYAIMMREIE